jgi:hypothetical protein
VIAEEGAVGRPQPLARHRRQQRGLQWHAGQDDRTYAVAIGEDLLSPEFRQRIKRTSMLKVPAGATLAAGLPRDRHGNLETMSKPGVVAGARTRRARDPVALQTVWRRPRGGLAPQHGSGNVIH